MFKALLLAVNLALTGEPAAGFAPLSDPDPPSLGGRMCRDFYYCPFFQKQRWLNLISADHQKEETFGALDLGGASTQITFVPLNSTIEAPENSLQFRLYGEDYTVYTHSFLCYGKDQALWQKLAKDVQASATEFSSPHIWSSAPTSCWLCNSAIGLKLGIVPSNPSQAGHQAPSGGPL